MPGSEPIATAYAGHQFGHFVSQLGDGRAHLLGEVLDQIGQRLDLQLKGSGPTIYSRGGDGRCAVGPAVREFIMSEAMNALGVPTTRCLAVVTTGEPVFRESSFPGAIVTRLASSHLRIGTFQFIAARGDPQDLKALCNYTIERHYPELKEDGPNQYIGLIDKVIAREIQLVVDLMKQHNPVVIPRNHHVEVVIKACVQTGKATLAENFLQVLRSPYEELAETPLYQDPPVDGDENYQTFCGT